MCDGNKLCRSSHFALVLLVGLLATLETGCGKSSVASKSAQLKIKTIPAILPLTGPSADLGRSVEQGMRLAEEDFSAAGKPYRLKVEDSQGMPERALTAYRSLSTANSNIVLSWMSSAGRALAPVTRADNRLRFVGAALSDLTADDGKVVRV